MALPATVADQASRRAGEQDPCGLSRKLESTYNTEPFSLFLHSSASPGQAEPASGQLSRAFKLNHWQPGRAAAWEPPSQARAVTVTVRGRPARPAAERSIGRGPPGRRGRRALGGTAPPAGRACHFNHRDC